ncbi:ras guanine nucleotide exchange factor domain-containing protein [Chytriomyces sp. MP71]|nr:ras guanine nucleotide exchange factor domain-containing protein [Chytriomyces sp. MP71]
MNIIELITSHNSYDAEMAQTLLMCHHSFITSVELLKCLVYRYETIIPPPNLNSREFQTWFEIKCKPIQQNVLKVVGFWIKNYFQEDFALNEILTSNARDFIDKVVVIDWEVNGKLLLGTLDLQFANMGMINIQSKQQVSKQFVPKVLGIFSGFDPNSIFLDASKILDLDPGEFAKQLTLFEFEEFSVVRPSECLDQIWSAKIQKELAAAKLQALSRKEHSSKKAQFKEYMSAPESAIAKMIARTNKLSLWIATTIISCTNPKLRLQVLKYFAHCAIKCRELHNYNGITGIVAGISMAPVARLHKTWRKFGKYYQGIFVDYEDAAAVVSPKGQYANYRKELKDIALPAIPFLGVYLTDITFIELGNTEVIANPADPNPSRSNRIINFDKCRKISAVIKEIQRFQVVKFSYSALDGLQEFFGRIGETTTTFSSSNDTNPGLSGLSISSEDKLYNQSLLLEPREAEVGDDSDDET